MATTKRILLIDRHPEWLQFAQEVLQEQYNVLTATGFEEAAKCCVGEERSQEFDLIFIGLDLATTNLNTIESLGRQWRFVVMFPVFQEDEKLRILFKAGVYDCADKPYEREGLLKLVADELCRAERLNGIRRPRHGRKRSDQGVLELERILNYN
jgi:DNA-binding NtrC family response regulator